MINSDWEGPWVTADHAFDIMQQGIAGGGRLFSVISNYDDYLAYVVKKPDYEPGNTLALMAPFLMAFGLDNEFLVARAKENANFIAGSIRALELLQNKYTVNIISTSYEQYVHYTAYLAGISRKHIYCTAFPIDEFLEGISEKDCELVRQMAASMLALPSFDTGAVTKEMDEAAAKSIEKLDEFFWEVLPSTGFSGVLEKVRPVGGVRKYEALIEALAEEGLGLEYSVTIGDSITDWKMLQNTRDAGGLAISFNGNEYAVSNCNVAVMSEHCMVTALLADLFERSGLQRVESLVLEWGWSSIKELNRQGLIGDPIYNAFRQAHTGADFPKVVWVTPHNIDNTIEISKQYRQSVRGTKIGELG